MHIYAYPFIGLFKFRVLPQSMQHEYKLQIRWQRFLSLSVVCESCLVWYYLKCFGLTAVLRKKLLRKHCGFANWCYGTDYAVEKKEIAETKVSICPRSYSIAWPILEFYWIHL